MPKHFRTARFILAGMILLSSIGLSGCIKPFQPDVSAYENLLVVDGLLTNDSNACTVMLTRSFPYYSTKAKAETGAIVYLADDHGTHVNLTEMTAGHYTSEVRFSPVLGRKYTLGITTTDGNEYLSNEEEFISPPEIDTIYFEAHQSPDNPEGISFFLDTRGTGDQTRYYRWEWEETWKIITPYYKTGRPNICFQSVRTEGITLGSSADLAENVLHKQFIYFLGTNTPKLAYQYSTLIKQYSLTHANYVFLTKLKKLNEAAGGFFDPIPAALTGNIKNKNHPEEPVLGIFEASAHASKRIFIRHEEIPRLTVNAGFDNCEITEISLKDYREGKLLDWFFIEQYFNSKVNDTMVVMINREPCFDCSQIASKDKPAFWRDK